MTTPTEQTLMYTGKNGVVNTDRSVRKLTTELELH